MGKRMILKPPRGAILNRTHPLARGLSLCLNINEYSAGNALTVSFDVATNQSLVWVGTPNVVAGGLELNMYRYLQVNSCASRASSAGSMVLGFIYKSNGQGFLASMRDGAGNRYYLSVDSSHAFTYAWAGTSNISTGANFAIGAETTIAMTWDRSVGCRIFKDGIYLKKTDGVNTSPTTAAVNTVSNIINLGADIILQWVRFYDRQLTDSEVKWLHANAYAMFESESPAKRFFDLGEAESVVGSRFIYSDIFPVTQLFRGNNL